jgi:hypothetical protein
MRRATVRKWLRLLCVGLALSGLPVLAAEIEDAQYGYGLSMPRFPSPAAGGSAMRLMMSAPPENGFSSNVGVMVQEAKLTADEYEALSKKQFEAAGITVIASSRRQVSGRPAITYEYQGPLGGRTLHWLSLAVILPERVVLVTCTADAAQFRGLESEFRRVLSSFILQK